jgi:hypothetical protein
VIELKREEHHEQTDSGDPPETGNGDRSNHTYSSYGCLAYQRLDDWIFSYRRKTLKIQPMASRLVRGNTA